MIRFLMLLLAPGLLLAQQPNFLIIMTDDVDVESFQAYAGNPVNTAGSNGAIATPNIETLAQQGLRFTNAFTTPLCTPTRVMLLTGQSNRRNYRAFGYLDNDQTTFAQVLRDNGYATAIAGKWQLSDPDGDDPIVPSGVITPNVTPAVLRDDYGFDSYLLWQLNFTTSVKGSRFWDPKLETASADNLSSVIVPVNSSEYGPDLFAQHLKDFMSASAASETPFLAYFPMALPHDPWVSTPSAPGATSGDNEIYFDDNVEYVDTLVGELLAHLDDPDGNPGTDDGIRENTIIIFTSDNGTSPRITVNTSERGDVQGDKGTASYDGTHVPFILDWGSKTPPSVESRMVDLSDVFPTLLEAAGITPDPELILDGQPIIDATGAVLDNKDAAYIWYDPKGRNFTPAEFAQNQSYKLYRDGRFFNITSDKLETNNLNDGTFTPEEQTNYDLLLPVLTAWDEPLPDIEPIAPDDPTLPGNLLLWLKDAAQNYLSGTWTDSSGNGNHASNVTGISGYGGSSGTETISPTGGLYADKSIDTVRLDDNDLMSAERINGGSGLSDLTILTVYQVSAPSGATRPIGIGSKTVEGVSSNFDRFNLGTDPSIRYDDGANIGSQNHPTHAVLRATRLTSGNTVSDWIDIGTGLNLSLDEASVASGNAGTSAPNFRTQNDDFYIGELGASVGGTDLTSSTYHIAQVAIYDRALSDVEIASVAAWMSAFPEGDSTPAQAWRLEWFDQTENAGDAENGNDFDLGGAVNLLERGLGTNPTDPADDFRPQAETTNISGDDYLTLTYQRIAGGTGTTGVNYTVDDITYTVEYDNDLTDPWSTGGITVVSVQDDTPIEGLQTVAVRLNTPVSTEEKQFIRLRITEIQ